MTPRADVARLVANSIDGAEFLDNTVVDVTVRNDEWVDDVYLTFADGSRFGLIIVDLTPSAAGNDREVTCPATDGNDARRSWPLSSPSPDAPPQTSGLVSVTASRAATTPPSAPPAPTAVRTSSAVAPGPASAVAATPPLPAQPSRTTAPDSSGPTEATPPGRSADDTSADGPVRKISHWFPISQSILDNLRGVGLRPGIETTCTERPAARTELTS